MLPDVKLYYKGKVNQNSMVESLKIGGTINKDKTTIITFNYTLFSSSKLTQ